MAAAAFSPIPEHVRAAILREMGHTFGSIYREGMYFALAFYIDGKRYRARSAPIETQDGRIWVRMTREIAEMVLEDVRAKVKSDTPPMAAIAPYLRHNAPDRAFRALWEKFVEAKFRQSAHGRQLSRERLGELNGHLRRGHLDALLNLPVERVTHRVLDDWSRALLDRKLASGTVHHVVADVGTFLRWLARRQEIAHAPELPTIRVRREDPKIPDPTTQARLFEAIPWAMRGIFLARGQHGLRPSEARRARVSDWNPTPQAIRLQDGSEIACYALSVRGKGFLNRTLPVPVDSDLARWVIEHRAKAFGNEPLFRNPKAARDGDGSFTKSATRRIWLAACKVAKVGSWHENQSMRHAYATALVNQGTGLAAISAALGHTDLNTTRRYALLGIGAHGGVLNQNRPRPANRPRGSRKKKD